MPLYACFIQEGALTRAQKAEIAGEITRIPLRPHRRAPELRPRPIPHDGAGRRLYRW